MNKKLSTVLKILGALVALAGIAAAVLYFLYRKGLLPCCEGGNCIDCENYEDCETCDALSADATEDLPEDGAPLAGEQ